MGLEPEISLPPITKGQAEKSSLANAVVIISLPRCKCMKLRAQGTLKCASGS